MRSVLKFAVGFTIGQLMSVVNKIGMLGIVPSVALAIVGTIIACVLIDFGFSVDDSEK